MIAKQERFETKTIPARLLHIDTTGNGVADTHVVANGLGKAEAILPKAEVTTLPDGSVEVRPQGLEFPAGGGARRARGRTCSTPTASSPSTSPARLPRWFGVLFLLTLLAAAMSTLSSQIHTMGTGIGHDVFKQLAGAQARSITVTRIGMIVGIVAALVIGYYARGGYVIARGTAIFFGLCASAFLPAFVGGLFFRGVTRAGAKASMVTGFLVTAFWLVFIKDAEAQALGICNALFGVPSLADEEPQLARGGPAGGGLAAEPAGPRRGELRDEAAFGEVARRHLRQELASAGGVGVSSSRCDALSVPHCYVPAVPDGWCWRRGSNPHDQ